VFCIKNAIFFGEKNFLIITSVPGLLTLYSEPSIIFNVQAKRYSDSGLFHFYDIYNSTMAPIADTFYSLIKFVDGVDDPSLGCLAVNMTRGMKYLGPIFQNSISTENFLDKFISANLGHIFTKNNRYLIYLSM
jgi:hypothetical protein